MSYQGCNTRQLPPKPTHLDPCATPKPQKLRICGIDRIWGYMGIFFRIYPKPYSIYLRGTTEKRVEPIGRIYPPLACLAFPQTAKVGGCTWSACRRTGEQCSWRGSVSWRIIGLHAFMIWFIWVRSGFAVFHTLQARGRTKTV